MRRTVVATIAALACAVLVQVGAVYGREAPANSFLRALYSDVKDGGSPGLILVDAIHAHSARLTVGLGGLIPGHSYRIVIGSRRCFEPNAPATRIARVNLGVADGSGAIFETLNLNVEGADWRNVWSLRLMEEEGIYYYCQTPNRLDRPRTAHVDGAFGRIKTLGRLAITVTATNDAPNFQVALDGLAAGARYVLVHSPLTCKQFQEGDPDQPIVVGSLRADSAGMAFAAHAVPTPTPTDLATGSLRVERRGDGSVWGCSNQHAYALFLPPG